MRIFSLIGIIFLSGILIAAIYYSVKDYIRVKRKLRYIKTGESTFQLLGRENYDEDIHQLDATVEAMKKLGFRKDLLSEEMITLITDLKMFEKYQACNMPENAYVNNENEWIVLTEVFFAHNHAYNQPMETQLLFWLKLNEDAGHCYFREKVFTERLFAKIQKPTGLILDNYESFVFEAAKRPIHLERILTKLKGITQVEIEFTGINLFIKTRKHAHPQDLKMMLQLAERIR